MLEKAWAHVGVIFPRSNSQKQMRAGNPVHIEGNGPARADDAEEEGPEEEPTLFATLNLNWVQMKVEFRGNVTIEASVHVFEVVAPRILIVSVGHGIGFVEAASSAEGQGCSGVEEHLPLP